MAPDGDLRVIRNMELLAKSNFSFLRGASTPEELVNRAAKLGHQSIALVDHMGFYGSARAHAEAQKVGIKAITGATLESVSEFHQLTMAYRHSKPILMTPITCLACF